MSINIIKKGFNVKDDKGHKIIAAVYLVTRHLSVTDPLGISLRTHAVSLIDTSIEKRITCAAELTKLIESAVLIGTIGEKNASIISYEVSRYVADELELPLFFQSSAESILKDSKRTQQITNMSFTSSLKDKYVPPVLRNSTHNRGERSEKILSFMKEKKSGTIKDIVTLFPNVSEKTIQRELGALVTGGELSKRGNKRWSVYFYQS